MPAPQLLVLRRLHLDPYGSEEFDSREKSAKPTFGTRADSELILKIIRAPIVEQSREEFFQFIQIFNHFFVIE